MKYKKTADFEKEPQTIWNFLVNIPFYSLNSFSVRGFVRFEHPWPLEPSKTMDSIEWNMPANQSIVNIFISKCMQWR